MSFIGLRNSSTGFAKVVTGCARGGASLTGALSQAFVSIFLPRKLNTVHQVTAFHQYSSASQPCETDWIHIAGMRFHGRHGVLPEETRLGQCFVVDVKLQVDTSRAGVSDALDDTVNYADVYCDVKEVVEGSPCKLLEAVAHRAVSTVLQRHPEVQRVDFTIRKLTIPGVPSVVDSVGVQIRRQR